MLNVSESRADTADHVVPGHALRLERLSFRYAGRRKWALREVGLDVAPGECLLVSGASGGGKTTLLRCFNGLIPHSYPGEYEGRALVFGSDVTTSTVPRIGTRVGTVFQNPDAQMLASTVESEVAFGVENLGVPADEGRARCDAALHFVGLSQLRDRTVRTLSGGEKQRVAIAGILVMRPSVLLLDEPLSNIDPGGVAEFVARLSGLRQAGFTVVLVEQRIRQVLELADRMIVLENGAIVRDERRTATSASPIRAWPAGLAEVRERHVAPSRHERACGPPREQRPGHAVMFDGVSFRYPYGPEILTGISLVLEAGSWVSVIGRNGCGKTTFAKLSSGLLKPTTGRVTVGGRDTSRRVGSALCAIAGYVSQNPLHALHASTVREEVAFYPTNLGWPREDVERSTDAALTALRLDGQRETSPFVLSSGEQQRVAIASALSGRPRILVLDEPTLGMAGPDLDALRRLIGTLTAAEGRLVITVTHDLDLVRCSDRVVVLSGGAVVADGAPGDILDGDLVTGLFRR